jgi:hypothetical protein
MLAKKPTAKRKLAVKREEFITKLFESAQKQLEDIDRRVEAGSRTGPEAERDARAVAALVKVLGALAGDDNTDTGKPADNDEGPRDLDEFRRELARQMDEIVARRTHRAAAGE